MYIKFIFKNLCANVLYLKRDCKIYIQVLVCFDNKILRGNRTIKNDAGSFAAFISPNLPPIATLEIRISGDVSHLIIFQFIIA